MSDLWNRQEQVLRGGLAADRLFMTWPALNNFGLGLMIQSIGCRYVQPIRRAWELGPGGVPAAGGGFEVIDCDVLNPPIKCQHRVQATYWMVGRAEGQVQFNRVVGPEPVTMLFYRTYGTPCASNILTISGRVGCQAGGGNSQLTRWRMSGVLLSEYQMQAAAQESFVQEGASGGFCNLFVEVVN